MAPEEYNGSLETPSIQDLNTRYAQHNIGGIVFVGTMMLIGIIGNAHVLCIYAFKFKPSNHRVYILCMASLDMATCCIGMPFIIVDLNNPLTFESVVICKSLRFLNYFMVIGSLLTLIIMAVDRYKSICKPFGKQMTTKHAKYACILALIISVSLSWPAPVLYGRSAVDAQTISAIFKTDYNITGTQCFTEDKYKSTKYQAYFNIILLAVIGTSSFVLCTLYGLIVRTIFKNSEYFNNECINGSPYTQKPAEVSPTNSVRMITFNKNQLSDNLEGTLYEFSPTSSVRLTTFKKHQQNDTFDGTLYKDIYSDRSPPNGNTNRNKACIKNWRADQSKKITIILAIVTVVFLLSYIPHLSMKTKAMLTPNFFLQLSEMELFLYNTFVWTFFISNMSNPIIYGLCVSKFRRHVINFYTRRKTNIMDDTGRTTTKIYSISK